MRTSISSSRTPLRINCWMRRSSKTKRDKIRASLRQRKAMVCPNLKICPSKRSWTNSMSFTMMTRDFGKSSVNTLTDTQFLKSWAFYRLTRKVVALKDWLRSSRTTKTRSNQLQLLPVRKKTILAKNLTSTWTTRKTSKLFMTSSRSCTMRISLSERASAWRRLISAPSRSIR